MSNPPPWGGHLPAARTATFTRGLWTPLSQPWQTNGNGRPLVQLRVSFQLKCFKCLTLQRVGNVPPTHSPKAGTAWSGIPASRVVGWFLNVFDSLLDCSFFFQMLCMSWFSKKQSSAKLQIIRNFFICLPRRIKACYEVHPAQYWDPGTWYS